MQTVLHVKNMVDGKELLLGGVQITPADRRTYISPQSTGYESICPSWLTQRALSIKMLETLEFPISECSMAWIEQVLDR